MIATDQRKKELWFLHPPPAWARNHHPFPGTPPLTFESLRWKLKSCIDRLCTGTTKKPIGEAYSSAGVSAQKANLATHPVLARQHNANHHEGAKAGKKSKAKHGCFCPGWHFGRAFPPDQGIFFALVLLSMRLLPLPCYQCSALCAGTELPW